MGYLSSSLIENAVYETPCVILYPELSPTLFAITPAVIERFINHVNEFNQTFTTFHHHLNYLGSFVINETNVIYTEQHPDVWEKENQLKVTFGSTTTFVLNHDEKNNFMFMKIIPKHPDLEKRGIKHHDLMRMYLHELRKVDQYRRRLRLILGDMQNLEAKYFNHIVNADIKNRSDIKFCIAKMHDCGRKWLFSRRRFYAIAKLKHFYLDHGVIKENDYQVEPIAVVVKNKPW